MTNAQSPIDALSRAKVTLVLSYPFFATLVCGMPVVIDEPSTFWKPLTL